MSVAYERVIAHLDGVSRTRALTANESDRLEWAMKQVGQIDEARIRVPWKQDDDALLMAGVAIGMTYASIAASLRRNPGSVRRRHQLLAKRVAA